MTKLNIEGRKVWIDKNGREVAFDATALASGQIRERINGPHHNAKWARHVLGTPTQAEVRRANRPGTDVARTAMMNGEVL